MEGPKKLHAFSKKFTKSSKAPQKAAKTAFSTVYWADKEAGLGFLWVVCLCGAESGGAVFSLWMGPDSDKMGYDRRRRRAIFFVVFEYCGVDEIVNGFGIRL